MWKKKSYPKKYFPILMGVVNNSLSLLCAFVRTTF